MTLLADVDCVDARDETYGSTDPQVTVEGDVVVVRVSAESVVWRSKEVTLRCREDSLEVSVTVEGEGRLSDVRLLGGHAVLADGAAGTFRSGIEFASVFSPNPTEPVQVVRSATAVATVGVLGDDRPGHRTLRHGAYLSSLTANALGQNYSGNLTTLRIWSCQWRMI